MTERFFTPPRELTILETTPLVFLAGPVQGAPDWQTTLAERIIDTSSMAVASPRRTAENQARFDADEQKAWEIAFRDRARKFGVTGFWLAAQDFTLPYPAGRAYAQTTRFEMGEAWGWRHYDPDVPIVVGIDPTYTDHGGGSESYMRTNCAHRGITVVDSLDELHGEILKIGKELTK